MSAYRLWSREHQEAERLREPKMWILYEFEQAPYLQEIGGERLFRVGVKNTGGLSLPDLCLDLVKIEPSGFPFLPAPLQTMHLRSGPLDPGDERHFDVVHELNNAVVEVIHTVANAPRGIPRQPHVLTLRAHAKHARAAERRFVVEIRGGKLCFFAEDQPQV